VTGNGPHGSLKGRELLDQLSYYQVFKWDYSFMELVNVAHLPTVADLTIRSFYGFATHQDRVRDFKYRRAQVYSGKKEMSETNNSDANYQ
jgi:hypothetical protein